MVATLHYPRPTSRDQAVRRRDVARALARIDRDALIVAGDMNLTPWAAAMREQDRALAPLSRMTRAPSWPRALPVLPIDHVYAGPDWRSEEHTSELQSLMRISYAVFCLKKKN